MKGVGVNQLQLHMKWKGPLETKEGMTALNKQKLGACDQ